MYALLRPLLFKLEPETAHDLTLRMLRLAQHLPLLPARPPQVAPCRVMGLDFPNPLGLAAGMDKNGECVDAWGALGFGFVEVGTVTPRSQPGNPKPRLFRLPAAQAVINRMGFNNRGVDALLDNICQRRYRGVLGINLGKNADTPLETAADDYVLGLRKVYPVADYVAVNISSPNTAGLRSLQHGPALEQLLGRLKRTQAELAGQHGKYVPLAVKIAPDLSTQELAETAQILRAQRVDAVIATNTTFLRAGVEHLPHAQETGGLSGAPLFERSTQIVHALATLTEGQLPIIAAGGVMSAAHAGAKLAAGASLVQVYSGLIYRGPVLVRECLAHFRTL